MDSIKERIGAYIERTGETKAAMAERLHMSKTTFYSKCKGDTEFTLTEGGRLANLLGCSVDDLFVSPFAKGADDASKAVA